MKLNQQCLIKIILGNTGALSARAMYANLLASLINLIILLKISDLNWN